MNNNTQRRNYKSKTDFRPFVIKDITFKKIRLIDELNKYHEFSYASDAQKQADTAGLDLVCFSKGNRQSRQLPLCKIIDYGKWKYTNDKNEKNKNQHQKHVTKEVQFSLNISDHDIGHKIKQANKFLQSQMDVRLVMRLFGRDRSHFDMAEVKMEEIVKLCSESGKIHDLKKTGTMISIRMIPV